MCHFRSIDTRTSQPGDGPFRCDRCGWTFRAGNGPDGLPNGVTFIGRDGRATTLCAECIADIGAGATWTPPALPAEARAHHQEAVSRQGNTRQEARSAQGREDRGKTHTEGAHLCLEHLRRDAGENAAAQDEEGGAE